MLARPFFLTLSACKRVALCSTLVAVVAVVSEDWAGSSLPLVPRLHQHPPEPGAQVASFCPVITDPTSVQAATMMPGVALWLLPLAPLCPACLHAKPVSSPFWRCHLFPRWDPGQPWDAGALASLEPPPHRSPEGVCRCLPEVVSRSVALVLRAVRWCAHREFKDR